MPARTGHQGGGNATRNVTSLRRGPGLVSRHGSGLRLFFLCHECYKTLLSWAGSTRVDCPQHSPLGTCLNGKLFSGQHRPWGTACSIQPALLLYGVESPGGPTEASRGRGRTTVRGPPFPGSLPQRDGWIPRGRPGGRGRHLQQGPWGTLRTRRAPGPGAWDPQGH